MEKLWERMEKNSEVPADDVDIITTLYFSPYKRLGEVRDMFDTWSISDLQSAADQIHWTTTDDEGATEETYYGERDEYTYHPVRESVIIQSHADTMWKLSSRRKKFF